MNSRAYERQGAEAAILAAFTLHYSLFRRLRVVEPDRASKPYDLALATYEENPGLRPRMREIAPVRVVSNFDGLIFTIGDGPSTRMTAALAPRFLKGV